MRKLGEIIHPGSWWLLGATLALVSGSASNLVTPLAISIAAVIIILVFRESASWARSLRFYLTLAGIVIAIRLLFRVLFSYSSPGDAIAIHLPRFQINLGLGSFQFLGDVTWISISGALLDGLRLAAIILSVAIATTLANPRKLLKSAPGALFEIATSVSVAVNLAPQLIESFNRVRKAKQLRGRSRKTSRLAGIVIPVLEDTLDRSLLLAASMDSRGFGRRGNQTKAELFVARLLGLIGLLLNLIGVFLLLGGCGIYLALGIIAIGLVIAFIGLRVTSRRKVRTNLNQQPRSAFDYSLAIGMALLIFVNFAGWLR